MDLLMTRKELGTLLAQYTEVSQHNCLCVYDTLIAAVKASLHTEGAITLPELGHFRLHKRAPYAARNPKTGARVRARAKTVVRMKCSDGLSRLKETT